MSELQKSGIRSGKNKEAASRSQSSLKEEVEVEGKEHVEFPEQLNL